MFYVVHVDDWFQTIPDNWVNKINKTIHWPTEKNAMLTMWIKKRYHTNRIGRYTFVCLDHSKAIRIPKILSSNVQDTLLRTKYCMNNTQVIISRRCPKNESEKKSKIRRN
ncbi:uncharacterized protein LOC118644938 [Monomorium pharaonis]|uniref:uncharacterized protein LOC118644938 n=1 Tax=Monomorium pharaonis TaxID=307658 RepID=UPI0017465D80|nr:uncharacterized protein LOC118644938 [Monomorium pharaonis]